jgi:hypothetical protein
MIYGYYLCRYYTVSLSIGNPPKLYDLDIDSGSDLTWVQCDAPCKGCTKVKSNWIRPHYEYRLVEILSIFQKKFKAQRGREINTNVSHSINTF